MTDDHLAQIFTTHPFYPERGESWLDYARGTAEQAIAWAQEDPKKRRVVDWIDKSKILWPVQVPVPDDPLLHYLMHVAASAWDVPDDMPDWRTNEYARGQLQVIGESCQIVTDEEYEAGDVESEVIWDRVWGWITGHWFASQPILTEDLWKLTPEYRNSGDWGTDINERRPVLVMWHDPTETPSEAVARLNGEAIENAQRAEANAATAQQHRALLLRVLELFTENTDKPIIDDAAGVDQDHVKMYASPEWYRRYVGLLATIRKETQS